MARGPFTANIHYPDGEVAKVTLLEDADKGRELVALQQLKDGRPWITTEAHPTGEDDPLYDVWVREE